jgi:hypothetical protein
VCSSISGVVATANHNRPHEFGKNRLDLGGNFSEDCLALLGEVENLAISVGAT